MDERKWLPLTIDHLKILKDRALVELERFLKETGSPPGKYSVYSDRLLAICLCQGAAQFYFESWYINREQVNETVQVNQEEIKEKKLKLENGLVLSGVKDIDIWFFFKEHPKVKIPHRGNMRKSEIINMPQFGEIRIDFMKKAFPQSVVEEVNSPIEMIHNYLKIGTSTANFLRQKSIVGLYPDNLFGSLIWKVKRIYRET